MFIKYDHREEVILLTEKTWDTIDDLRKSKVADAIKNWHEFEAQLNDIVKKENGYGLPRNFNLESDVSKWDYYDLLVVAYYCANTEYDGKKTAKVALRSKDYAGTSRGLIDRALQLGTIEEDIRDMYKFSEDKKTESRLRMLNDTAEEAMVMWPGFMSIIYVNNIC